MNNKPIAVITGAGGFLGRYLVEEMVSDFGIRAVDLKSPSGNVDLFQGSVTDRDLTLRALNGADGLVIAHMAPRQPGVYDDVEMPFEINVKGTARLLQSAVETGVRTVVLISSVGVVAGAHKAGQFLTTDLSPSPNDIYGLTKCLQEDIARYYHQTSGISVAILRPAYICLEDDLTDKYGRQRPSVNWQFIDPRDIGHAASLALRSKDLGFEIFHLVAGPGASEHADIGHAAHLLGWHPRHTFSAYPRDA